MALPRPDPDNPQAGRRRIGLWLVLAGLLYGAFEFLALGALAVLESARGMEYTAGRRFELAPEQHLAIRHVMADRAQYSDFSPELGWTIRPHGRSELYQANGQGLRADREYALAADAGRLRIASFGDSYTHGTDVDNASTWQAHLDRLAPGVEVLNFGVGAYGLDQAFLRYRLEGRKYNPDVVLIGFMSENIFRSVSVFRPFYVPKTGAPLAKPRFLLDGNGLKLLPNPLRTAADYERLLADPDAVLPGLGEHDYFYQTRYRPRPGDFLPSARLVYLLLDQFGTAAPVLGEGAERFYNTRSEAFEVTARLFKMFYREVEAGGAVPVIVMFPHIEVLRQFRDQGTRRYQPMLDRFEAEGLRYVDMLDGFVELQEWKGKRQMFLPGFSHYSPVGNEMVARILYRYLVDNKLYDRPPGTAHAPVGLSAVPARPGPGTAARRASQDSGGSPRAPGL